MRAMIVVIGVCVGAASGQVINHDLKFASMDGANGDRFGDSMAVFGSIAVIGAPYDRDAGTETGAAYLFDTTNWQQLFKLTASDAASGDLFGFSVDISDAHAIVCGYLNDDAGSLSGSAYLFDVATGLETFKLTASDAAAGDLFGYSVAIDGNIAIVGAPQDDDRGSMSGSVYVFDVTTGQQLMKLTANDGAAEDRFGIAVELEGNTAVIGANGDADAGIFTGSAYVFDISTGQQLFKLTASDPGPNELFGDRIAISGSTAIISARADRDLGPFSGSAYLFDVTTGQQLHKLLAADGGQGHNFGWSVDISGTHALIGANGNPYVGTDAGSAYVFDTATGQQLFQLIAADPSEFDRLGSSVALSGSTAIVGAAFGDDGVAGSGTAYVFEIPTCVGDFADDSGTVGSDGRVSFGDFLALLGRVGPCPSGIPGCTGDIANDFGTIGSDGMVSFGDFLALLGLVGPCP